MNQKANTNGRGDLDDSGHVSDELNEQDIKISVLRNQPKQASKQK